MTDLRQELMRGEQWTLEVRTSDPQNPSPDERWIRSDLDSGDKIATYRTGDGTDIPIYPTGTAEDTVSEAIRIEVSGQTGYAPIAPESDAEFQSRQVQHNGQRYAHHNSVSPGAAIPDSGISRYEFEQDVTDSWNNNDATDNTSAGYVTGTVGSFAKDFDGTDDEVVFPFQFDDTEDFSIVGWVNLDVMPQFGHIVGARDAYSTADWVLQYNTDTTNEWSLAVGESFAVSESFASSLSTNTWYHFGLTKGGDTWTFYEDASSLGTLTTSQGWTTSDDITIGASEDSGSDQIDGAYDHLDFYSKELSASEVSNHRSTGSI
jgi:hypothetical protein